jgi:hypothetical protein
MKTTTRRQKPLRFPRRRWQPTGGYQEVARSTARALIQRGLSLSLTGQRGAVECLNEAIGLARCWSDTRTWAAAWTAVVAHQCLVGDLDTARKNGRVLHGHRRAFVLPPETSSDGLEDAARALVVAAVLASDGGESRQLAGRARDLLVECYPAPGGVLDGVGRFGASSVSRGGAA